MVKKQTVDIFNPKLRQVIFEDILHSDFVHKSGSWKCSVWLEPNIYKFSGNWTNRTHCKVSCANTGPSTNTRFYFLQDQWPSVLVTFDNEARHFVISVPDITESPERGMKTDLGIGAGARKQKKSWTKRARDTTVTRLWRPTGGTWIIGVSLLSRFRSQASWGSNNTRNNSLDQLGMVELLVWTTGRLRWPWGTYLLTGRKIQDVCVWLCGECGQSRLSVVRGNAEEVVWCL